MNDQSIKINEVEVQSIFILYNNFLNIFFTFYILLYEMIRQKMWIWKYEYSQKKYIYI